MVLKDGYCSLQMLRFGNELAYLASESAEDFEEHAEETDADLRAASITGKSRLLEVNEDDDGEVRLKLLF